ncbi:dolichyl-diphosphooligosaccharide--protein glycosyltransferase subunit 1 [Fopius arisanus]|uniref:Dolichyl-diphosphooligosaccharide--protein glycosyltransferase subunit 1 n=1 Tax=Fopius arisanus TaxID=64838 RepID=A0A9R1U6U2_9HYME|nr:PREDICTED: dolichyl-diphosphooligosaccharide--protein glycosyltransferase subunit 1 [Fopius arisanus]
MTLVKNSLRSLAILMFLSSLTIIFALEEFNTEIVLKNVDRTIDVQSHLTKITTKLVVENTGKTPIKYFYYAMESEKNRALSYIGAHTRDASRAELVLLRTKLPGHEGQILYKIELKDSLQSGRTIAVEVESVSTHELAPYPKQISQKEKQLVKYIGNAAIWSPYNVLKQTTNVVLPSRNLESFTRIKPVSVTDTTIIYGPLEKRLPYSYEEFTVHFENNNKFLTVVRLERVLEVSHWGNIAVEETIDLLHTGALLKGSFSRYEYSRESRSGQASIQSFDTILPAAASDIYYRDEIGNISTSHTRVKKDSVDVNLRPRFPLFGGWKTRYTIGYNVPSYEYLFQNGEDFILKMRVLDHVFDDMVVDELLLTIILPEGSKNLELVLPYEATRLPDSLHYSYLDTCGRPVISITKKNLVENHIQDFKLKYNFPRMLMLQEPVLVSVALYLLFLLVIIYVRLDFSIDKDEASESRLRIAGQCEKILVAQDRRVTSYNELDEHLIYLKANKDTGAFLSAMKSINQEYKNATTTVNELAQKLRSDSAEVYERIQELQKHDKQLKEFYNQQQALYVDKLVPGKISRQQFVDAEGIITRKKEECVEKINAIVKSLH